MDARENSSAEPGFAEQLRSIRANAELVIRTFAKETEFKFGYNEESVKWLDAYIEIIRQSERTDEEFKQLVSNLGSFLGETIIKAFGGVWTRDQRGWAVRWDEFNLAYPFLKVAKQLQVGQTESIYSFYAVTGALRRG